MNNRKGIVLAGGSGTRLYPITLGVSKQLLPIYDKPMIYYPLSVLMLAGIKDILVISTATDIENYKKILDDGSKLGINISYKIQDKPEGIAQAFIIGEDFIGNSNVALVLGDNIFYGHNFTSLLESASQKNNGASLFGYHVKDPQRFGVVDFDENMIVKSIIEKPSKPRSNYAVTGLYFYDNNVVEYSKSLDLSPRGEYEITDINNIYMEEGNLYLELLGRGFAWLDTGTHDTLLEASKFVQTIEQRQGLKVACLEEIAYVNNWISRDALQERADFMKNTNYGNYLLDILKNDN